MPQKPKGLQRKDTSGKTISYSSDVTAALYEGDCSARQRVRRLRGEFYLGGKIQSEAAASESFAASDLAVEPTSEIAIALAVLCNALATTTSAPNMAEARRITDGHFRAKAAGGKK